MHIFFQKIFTRYPIKSKRSLEILPGIISWTIILSPLWASLFFPFQLAYFILFFDVCWFYKSFSLVVWAFMATERIKKAEKTNWLKKAQEHPDFNKVTHILVLPNYKERVEKIEQTLDRLCDQTISTKKLFIVLGMEEREQEAKEKAQILIRRFKPYFGDIFATYHPDAAGEVKGKSSNESYAGRVAYKKLVTTKIIDPLLATISSVDVDSLFDAQYFSYLTHEFLTSKRRYNTFWQSANVTYNNFWSVPAPVRVLSFFGSVWRTALLVQGDRLVSNSTYSLSLSMLVTIGFWDTDVIPEDYRIFFKAFYTLRGNAWVDPIFLRTSMDAPESTNYWKSLKNKYDQERRWSWGVSDDQLFMKWWLTVPGVPFVRKTVLLYHVLLDHFLWPANWFIITIAANIIPLINPIFSRTTVGYTLPGLAGFILTSCLFAILALIIIDFRGRPQTAEATRIKQFLFPLEFVLLPIVGFFLSTLPAIISHTFLLIGKRTEYKVTEKI